MYMLVRMWDVGFCVRISRSSFCAFMMYRCSICKQSRDPHMMALCDTCKKCYHINCLDPPLSKVPKKSTRWGW